MGRDREFSSVEEVTARIKEIDKEIIDSQSKIDEINKWLKPWEDAVIQGRREKERLFSVRRRIEKEMRLSLLD